MSSTLVMVLGMHRAGTSLATAILSALGVNLSADLLEPTQENPMGYFESQSIVRIHDAILDTFGRSWSVSSTMVALPAEWWRKQEVAPFKNLLSRIASDALEAAPMAWGFKDPRTAQMLPLWHEIAADLGVSPRYIVAVRNPSEVAGSLHVRDSIDPVRAELLWIEHYLDAVLYTNGARRVFIDYEQWFTEPLVQAGRLAGILDVRPNDNVLQSAIAKFVVPGLRHHVRVDERPLLPYSREFYSALRSGDGQALEALVPFSQLRRIFGTYVVGAALDLSRQSVETLQSRVKELEGEIAGLRSAVRK